MYTQENKERVKIIRGKDVYLRLMEEKDIPYKVKWINNSDFRATLNFDYPVSEIGTKNWLNQVSANKNRKDFIICDSKSEEPIGFCGFLNIDYKSSKTESYMGIAEKKYRGKGLGKQVRILLLDYAFNELNINKVYSYVWVKNTAMTELNKKVGFKIEGHLRSDVLSHGELRDRYIMGILKSEYILANIDTD